MSRLRDNFRRINQSALNDASRYPVSEDNKTPPTGGETDQRLTARCIRCVAVFTLVVHSPVTSPFLFLAFELP